MTRAGRASRPFPDSAPHGKVRPLGLGDASFANVALARSEES
jgi:hypothetical protein